MLCGNCHAILHYNDNRIDSKCLNNKKTLLIYAQKSKCDECGWNGSPNGLHFHHRDPTTKEFSISSIQIRLNINKRIPHYIKDEVDKCDLLCVNCHRRKHIDFEKIHEFRYEILKRKEKYKPLNHHDTEFIKELTKTMSYKEIEKKYKINRSTIHYHMNK
jgi:hypothetical protein